MSIGNVLYPVRDVAKAVAFYRDALGLAVRFTDDGRFAALDGGGTTFALAGPQEDVTGGEPAASFRVDDTSEAVERLTAAGARLVRGPEDGPHETRAVLRDPDGNPLIVYSRRG